MPLKILVVEDSPAQVLAIKEPLMKSGYDVSVAGNGAEGYQIASAQRPDLILLDTVMPVLDGPGFLRLLRETPELASTPVIMLTALSSTDTIRQVVSLGVQGYLVKPFTMEAFGERLRAIFPKLNFDLSPKQRIQADIPSGAVRYEEIDGVHLFEPAAEHLRIAIRLIFTYVRRLAAVGERRFAVDFTAFPRLPADEMAALVAATASLQKAIEWVRFISPGELLREQLAGHKETAQVKVVASRPELTASFQT